MADSIGIIITESGKLAITVHRLGPAREIVLTSDERVQLRGRLNLDEARRKSARNAPANTPAVDLRTLRVGDQVRPAATINTLAGRLHPAHFYPVSLVGTNGVVVELDEFGVWFGYEESPDAFAELDAAETEAELNAEHGKPDSEREVFGCDTTREYDELGL